MAALGSFDDDIAVRPSGEGHFTAEVREGWDVRGNPHGGYLLAMVARAAGAVLAQPDPVSVSATYLAPPRFGPAELTVTVLRAGKRQSTATVRLTQDGVERLDAVVTFGTLGTEPSEILLPDAVAPALPDPAECLPADAIGSIDGQPINLHERLHLRLHPETGWITDAPTGVPELHGWLSIAPDAERPSGRSARHNPYALLLFTDGIPPSLLEAIGRQGAHTPTMQLTTHLFAQPAPGWIQGRFRTRVRAGSLIDEDGELWDSAGTLVATTRQLALLRRS